SDVARVDLEHNYRCGNEIIHIANQLRQGAPIKGFKEGGQVSVVHCPGGLDDQYHKVEQHIQAAILAGTPLHEIAILCPRNDQWADVAEVLRQNGIAVSVRESLYRVTAVTGLIEGCAAWATTGRECSNYRLDDLVRRWRLILGDVWTMKHSVEFTSVLMAFG